MDLSQGKFIVKTFFGLEKALAEELKSIGAGNIEIINRGVKFDGNKELLYKANIYLRTALRVLVPFSEGHIESTEELYEFASKINWLEILSVSDTFAIDPVVNSVHIKHSKYAALKLKDAIADYFRQETGVRPSVNTLNPNYRINLHISRNKVTLSLDSSGESLHKRGYRSGKGPAPLNEALAAGLLKLSGWKADMDFLDPMCGSGAIAIEAALIARNVAPGIIRNSFGFMKWQDYDEGLFKRLIKRAEAEIKESDIRIFAGDIEQNILRKAKLNAIKAGMEKSIKFFKGDFFESEPKINNGIIVTNPPYDERLKKEDIKAFYKNIGDTLKQKYNGSQAWILSGNLNALKNVGLKASEKIILLNGPIESRFVRYELYSGSRKTKES